MTVTRCYMQSLDIFCSGGNWLSGQWSELWFILKWWYKRNTRKSNVILHLCHCAVTLHLNLLSYLYSNLKGMMWRMCHMWQSDQHCQDISGWGNQVFVFNRPHLKKSSFSAEQLKSVRLLQIRNCRPDYLRACTHTDTISLQNTYQCDHSWWCTTAE